MSKPKREKLIANIGETYNHLTLLEYLGYSSGNKIGLFRCDCGAVVEKAITNVIYGGTKSCGHLLKTIGDHQNLRNKYIDKKEGMFDWDDYGNDIMLK